MIWYQLWNIVGGVGTIGYYLFYQLQKHMVAGTAKKAQIKTALAYLKYPGIGYSILDVIFTTWHSVLAGDQPQKVLGSFLFSLGWDGAIALWLHYNGDDDEDRYKRLGKKVKNWLSRQVRLPSPIPQGA